MHAATSASRTLIKVCLISLLVWTMHSSVYAQYYTVNTLSSELVKVQQGLSQNSVRCILKDRQGFMWYGTWEGLNRYDGIEFRIINYKLDDPENSLSNQTVNCLAQDPYEFIWVGTLAGVNIIDPKTFKIEHLDHNNGLIGDTILSMHLHKGKYMWVGTSRGIQIIHTETRKSYPLNKLYNTSVFNYKEIRSIHAQNDDILWIGTDQGLYRLNLICGKIQRFTSQSFTALSSDIVTSISSYKDSLLFVGTENGFNILNLNTQKIKHYYTPELGNNAVLSLMLSKENKLWIGTSGGGISTFDPNNNAFERLDIGFMGSHQISTNISQQYVHCMYESQDELIWIGTASSGVIQLNTKPKLFKHFYKFTKSASKAASAQNVWSLMYHESDLWIGTDYGIQIYHIHNHQMDNMNTTHGLRTNRIRSIYKDSRGIIWIGTFKGGLHAYNPKTKEMQVYAQEESAPYHISDNTVWKIKEDNNHNLWIATYNGLNKLNLLNNEMEIYMSTEDSNSISANKVYSIFLDSEDELWFGTIDGLNKYNEKTNDFTVFKHIKGDTNSLSTNRIFDMYEDAFNNLWIGTMGGGLNRFNKTTHEVHYFTESDGLSNNVVYNVIGDEQGGIWMSTNRGVSHLNLFNEEINTYGVQDGLQGLEYNLGAALKDPKGNLYFGGTNGFNVLNPNDINQLYQAPLASLTSVEVMGKEMFSYLQEEDTLELSHQQNSISLSFAALDFTNPQQNRYRYKLQNYDEGWIYANPNNNKVTYNGMQPGTYVFQLYVAGHDKQWGSIPLNLVIKIHPPWYKTWIFRIAFVLSLALSIYLFLHIRIRRIKKQHQIQQKLLDLERQSLRLQMNPHFIFNTLNSIQSYVLHNKQDDSIQYLSKFSKLMRMMLTSSRAEDISIADEIKLLTYYIQLERLRFDMGFDFEFDIDEQIDQEFVEIPPMILQPYIENAIIHGLQPRTTAGGMLRIRMKIEGEFINIRIEDNGIGREASQARKLSGGLKHQSKGMLITKERLELLNKDVEKAYSVRIIDRYDTDGKATGTCVELLIRYDEDDE